MILFFLLVSTSLSSQEAPPDDMKVLKTFSDSFMSSKNDFTEPMANSFFYPLTKSKEMNQKMNRTNAGEINDEVTARNLTSKLEMWRGFSNISSMYTPALEDVKDLVETFSKVPASVRESFLNSTLEKNELPRFPTRFLNLISSSKIQIDESEDEMAEILEKYPLSIALLYKVLIFLRNSPKDKREKLLAKLNVPASLQKDLGYAIGYRWNLKSDDLPLNILLKFPADSIVDMEKESFEVLKMPIKLSDNAEFSRASIQARVAWFSKFSDQKGWKKIIESEEDFKHHGHLLAGASLDHLRTLRNTSLAQTLLVNLVNLTDFDTSRAQVLWEALTTSGQDQLFSKKANQLDISQVLRHFEVTQGSPRRYQEEFELSWFGGKKLSSPWATVMYLGFPYMSDQDYASWSTQDIKDFGKFIKILSPAEIDQLGVDSGSFSLSVLEDVLSASLSLPQLTSLYSKYKEQLSPEQQVMTRLHPILFPALSSSELLSSPAPFLWSEDRDNLLARSDLFSPGQTSALQEVTRGGRWAAANISSILRLQPRLLSSVLPGQLKTNLESLLAGLRLAGYHRFYQLASNIQQLPRHLIMAWLEEALARYRAEGHIQPDLIDTEVLLDMVTEETQPDLRVTNPDHTHPLASVFDRWTAGKKTYLTNLLLTGLSCQQIKMLRNGDFLEILAVYRYHHKSSGLSTMPSSSRKCFAKKLRDYLKFKSLVLNVTVQSETELLSLLNTAEIKTVGGEVLLTWGGPVLSSIVNPEVGHEVLMEIAMTRPTHYLTNGVLYTCLQKMADALLSFMIQQEKGLVNFRVLSHVHNLIPFTDSRILEASAEDLRMYVRAVLSDDEKTLCLNKKDRDLMRNLVLKAYGPPSAWNSLDLVELGDLLIVLRSSDLATVAPTSLRLAASQLANNSQYSTILSEVRGSVSGSMYHEACLGWLGSEEGKESSESLMYRKQWKMLNEFIVVGNFLQFEVLMKGLSVPKPRLGGGFGRRKRQAENPSSDPKEVYLKVMEVMKAKFNDGELSDDQKKNATETITSTQDMLSSYSFDVLGLEKGNLSSAEILNTLALYRDSGNMTEEQSSQISRLAVDTHVRMIQELAPLLGLNATSLNLTEAEYSQLMSRPTFVIAATTSTAAPVTLEVQDLLVFNNTEAASQETSEATSKATTLAENLRESKIINEEVTTVVSTENTSTASEGSVEKNVTEGLTTPLVSVELSTESSVVSTEATTALPDLGAVLSSPDMLDLATFTHYEPESEVFQRIPSLAEVVLTCDVLTASGSSAAVIGEANIRDMESRDLVNCLETLGQVPWTSSSREDVWRALKSKINLFSDSELKPIKREMMFQLHNLLPAVVSADQDLIDVTEDNIDGLSIIGKLLEKESVPLGQPLVQRYLTTNKVTSLSPTVAASLGQLLCGLSSEQWQSLLTGPLLAGLVTDTLAALQCEVSPATASHLAAQLTSLYGPPGGWNVSDLASLGWLASTLSSPQLSSIPPPALEGLAPLALKFFTASQWAALSPAQLSFLSPHTASFISTDLIQSVSSSPGKMREIRAVVGEDPVATKEMMEMMDDGEEESENSGSDSVLLAGKIVIMNLCVFYNIINL